MKRCLLPFLFLLSLLCWSCELDDSQAGKTFSFKNFKLVYPDSYPDTTLVDNYHGSMVKDPYRWLEKESRERQEWVRRQRSVTDKYLDHIPYRAKLKRRLENLWDYERYSNPEKAGEYYYIFKNDGLQNQGLLYRMSSLDSELDVVLDPNKLSEDGSTSLANYSFSKDGSLMAYQIFENGSDWRKLFVMDLKTKTLLKDSLTWMKGSDISWYRDGFFYGRYPKPAPGESLSGKNEFHQVYYHRVGTNQDDDELVFADRSNSKRSFSTLVTDDERFLILSASESTSGNALYYRDLRASSQDFIPIVEHFENDFETIGNIGSNLLVLTNNKAPKQRIIQINSRHPEEKYWEELIAEKEDVIGSAKMVNDKLFVSYIHNASSQMKVYDKKGKESGVVKLPDIGTITGISANQENLELFFSFSTFTRPESIYRLDVETGEVSLYKSPEVDFDSDAYVTKQEWYKSYDGTRIPIFIIHKKGIELDGSNPALLYGYGGFDISVLPIFNRTRLNLFPVVMENDGICAVANIRGGGEFGTEWHKAGTKLKKQNSFNDFLAAAEYLISNQFTSSEKLAAYGRSNGGLLIGACMTQRPDLFQVAMPAVGVLDMLRYHKFTIGWAWEADYGTSDDPEQFDNLLSYSPVHNVVSGNFPATLITTADHDDRVVPAHSFKFAAELQAKQKTKVPVLIRIDTRSGHGAGKSTAKKIEEGADILAFMFYNMKEEIE